MLKTIAALLAVLIFGSQPVGAIPNPSPDTERHVISHSTIPNARALRKSLNPIKLTVRHFPIHRIFADEDDDDSLSVAQHAMLHRREFELQAVTDVADNDTISDSVALRLWLIRQQALKTYKQHWG